MDNIKDSYKDHNIHDVYEEGCSTCYSENRLIRSKMIVGRTLPYEKGELHNWHGDNYPLGFYPEW